MRLYLITVKLPRNTSHDPHKKVTGPCPVTGELCTDVTGQHHTVLYHSDWDIHRVRAQAKKLYDHVTRIEIVPQ